MLIAIMGDTFSRVLENKERYALMERTQIYADFIYSIKFSDRFEGKRFAYVVTPLEDTDESGWEGTVGSMRHLLNKQTNEMKSQMSTINHKLSSLQHDQRRMFDAF